MKRLQRMICLLLSVLTLSSGLCLPAQATNLPPVNAVAGGAGSSGGNQAGTFNSTFMGYRMYFIDDNGKRISRKVDILFDTPARLTSGTNYYTWNDRFEDVTTDETCTIFDANSLDLYSTMPRPMILSGTFIGNGDNLREWMMAGEKAIQPTYVYVGSGTGKPSTGNTNNTGTTTTPTTTKPTIDSADVHSQTIRTVCDSIRNAAKAQRNIIMANQSAYTRNQAYASIVAAANRRYNAYVSSGAFNPEDYAEMAAVVTEIVDSLESDLTYEGWKNTSRKSTDASNIISSIFDMAYAANTTGTTTATEKGNIYPLLNTNGLFDGHFYEGIVEAEQTTDTMINNNLKLIVEAVYWWRPETMVNGQRGTGNGVRFYGTLNGYGKYMAYNKAHGGWTDGDNTGGWYGLTMNNTGAIALYLPEPLTINNGKTTLISAVYPTKVKRTNDQLADGSLGYNCHYYYGVPRDLPSTQTYDEPEGNTPHPAPDPSPENIPLANKEPKEPGKPITPENPNPEPEGYLNTTRTINIVKVYDVEQIDGTIEHVTTTLRQYNPGTISIEHEPQYKVIGYFSSSQYYGDIPGLMVSEDLMWEEIKETITPTQDTLKETTYDKVKTKTAGTVEETVKIGKAACDCEPTDPNDPTTALHYNDNTLYVHLLKKNEPPRTHTWDNTNYPDGEPGMAPDPTTDEYLPDCPIDPENPFLHYRIVKVYEEENEEGEIEHVVTLTRYPTCPIVLVESEPQYQLIEWKYGTGYIPVSGSTEWDDSPISSIKALESGTAEKEVDMVNYNDYTEERTIYVRLRKPYKGVMVGGDIIIQQSQISKAVHTNDSNIGGRWGNYKFELAIGAFETSHTYYVDHGCCQGHEDCSTCHGHTCNLAMPGIDGDNKLNFVFAQIGDENPLQIALGVHSKTDTKIYSKVNQPETITGLGVSSYSYSSDGNQTKGEEMVTVLWRGTSLLKDLPTLAKYKQTDIQNQYGTENYEIPQAMLKNASNTSKKTRKTEGGIYTLQFEFGIDTDASDIKGVASCSSSHEGSPCPYHSTRYANPTGGTDWTYTFEAAVNILVYSGQAKSLAAEPFGGVATKTITKATANHFANTVVQGKQQVKWFPYIKMTYMTNELNKAILEEQNKTTSIQPNARYDTYVLSEHESSILPSDSVEVGWTNSNESESLLITSQQWSLHQRATNNGKDWNGKNQVLPGGAIYQLSTPSTSHTNVKLVTFQTVVDTKTRQYLSSTLTGDEYTEAKVAQDHTAFVNEAKEVLDNLRLVQWVNKDTTASTAWATNWNEVSTDGAVCIRGGGESLTELGLTKETNTEEKYYMKAANNLISYANQKLGKLTKDMTTGDKETSNEGDLDIFSIQNITTVFKVFTDTSGNVYLASVKQTGTENTETIIKNLVNQLKDLNADTMSNSGYSSVTIEKLCDKTVTGAAINGVLSEDAKQIDDRTSFITNAVSALTRNKGADKTAEWSATDGRWYNEAFDGIYLVRQATTLEIGLQLSALRTAALDPALCPANLGQSDLYSTAFLSQFCLNDKSDAAVAQDKAERYIGTFKGVDITLPDMEGMYQSKKFYIPNANVQDLN